MGTLIKIYKGEIIEQNNDPKYGHLWRYGYDDHDMKKHLIYKKHDK